MIILTDKEAEKVSHFAIQHTLDTKGVRCLSAFPKYKGMIGYKSDVDYELIYGKMVLHASSEMELLDLIIKAEPIVR